MDRRSEPAHDSSLSGVFLFLCLLKKLKIYIFLINEKGITQFLQKTHEKSCHFIVKAWLQLTDVQ